MIPTAKEKQGIAARLRLQPNEQPQAADGSALGKPTIKLEFDNNEQLQEFFKEHEENLIDSYAEMVDPDERPDYSRPALQGPKDADSYNYKLEDLNTDGMSPTYQKLDDYGPLILKKANGKSTKVGDGFDATEKLLIDKVIANWESVKPLAKHLKADTERQSAFNVWYWLQENVRYNYDAEGKEEIRDPARTWEDRKRGVDCDCLAVFTYCLLLAMGYRPKFEIVAFMGKNTWAHIYVNLNGLAVDRVLATFGRRPALISKTKMLEVPVYSLSGPSCLEGLADTVLKKIENGTATAEDCCNYRKITALRNFNGHPVEQKTLAMFMPYIKDIDLTDGSIYFMPDYQKLAEVARWADSKLIQLADKQRCGLGDAEYQAELAGFFKKLGKFLATPFKAAYNTTKAAVKSTVNAVSATYNTVKAGVQAVTGNTEGAKESILKAGTQLKDAVVDPVKTEVKNNVEAVKVTVDLVKVLLVKINPVTVLMRNALRALVAINFLGIANRLYMGYQMYTAQPARAELAKKGYTDDELDRMKKAFERVDKFYTKMGGDRYKIWDAITKGNKRKALFKGDYKDSQTINDDDTLNGLGEPVTIGSCLAAVGAFFAKIWSWVKDIIPKGVQWIKDHKEIINTVTDVVKTVTNKDGGNGGTPETTVIEDNTNTTEKESGNGWLLWVAGGLAVGAFALSGDKKGKKRK